MQLKSFDKSYISEVTLKRPEKYREIEKFSKESQNLITMGSNYSYAPLALDKKSLVIDLSQFNRILSFDKKKRDNRRSWH